MNPDNNIIDSIHSSMKEFFYSNNNKTTGFNVYDNLKNDMQNFFSSTKQQPSLFQKNINETNNIPQLHFLPITEEIKPQTQGGTTLTTLPTSLGKFKFASEKYNNPLNFQIAAGKKENEFTKILKNAGFGVEVKTPVYDNPTGQRRLQFIGDPWESTRVLLSQSGAIQNWYAKKGYGGAYIPLKYGVKTNKDFSNLSREQQNQLMLELHKHEGSSGLLTKNLK